MIKEYIQTLTYLGISKENATELIRDISLEAFESNRETVLSFEKWFNKNI